MKAVILFLLLGVATAEETRLLCSYYEFDLCLGVSAGDKNPKAGDPVQLKGRIQNQYNNNTWRSVAVNISDNKVTLSAFTNLSIAKEDGTTKAIWNKEDQSTFEFVRVNLTTRIKNSNNKCLTIMRCASLEDWCDPTSFRPVRGPMQIKNGAYVRYRNCTPDLDVAQLFIENPQCAPGCTDEMLMNDVCDSVCNTKSCKWDLRKCPRSPTASSSPTVSPTVSPSFSPTFSPTMAPTFSPTGSPTVVPTFSPTASPLGTDTPTESPEYEEEYLVHPTFAPTPAPSTEPTASPSQEPTTEQPTTSPEGTPAPTFSTATLSPTSPPVTSNNTTRQPTKEYETYEKITKSPSTKQPTPGITQSPTEDDMANYEDLLQNIKAISVAVLVVVIFLLLIVSYWYCMDTKNKAEAHRYNVEAVGLLTQNVNEVRELKATLERRKVPETRPQDPSE